MNNENNSQLPKVDSVVQPPNPNPTVSPAPVTVKKPRNWLKISLAAALCIIVVLLIAGAYYLGTMSSSNKVADATTTTPPSTVAESDELPGSDSTPVADPYAGWVTYTSSVYGYSFKYPADWQVHRTVIQDPADSVGINPPGDTNGGSNDRIAIVTYFDGTGCGDGETLTKQFNIGGNTVEGTATCGSLVYNVNMKHSGIVGTSSKEGSRSHSHKATLVAISRNQVGVRIDIEHADDKIEGLILKSLSGLTPL